MEIISKGLYMKNLKIGNLHFSYGLSLAPMAGVTDSPFRQICKSYGAQWTVSEMISAKAIHFHDKKTLTLAHFLPIERPIAIQLFGSDPAIMAEAAKVLCDLESPPDMIDINMGCPVRKIVNNGEGSALMKNPSLAQEIVCAIKSAVNVPVTVKFRTGFTNSQKNAVSFAKAMQEAGADAVCLHGRTREQMYAPPIDYEMISQVKAAITIPVIANGGIQTVEDAKYMIEQTKCDGIALARGCYGNPFLFEQIKCYLDGLPIPVITQQQKLETAKRHFSILLAEKGKSTGILEARRQISWYFSGFEEAASYRKAFFEAVSTDDFEKIFEKIQSKLIKQ